MFTHLPVQKLSLTRVDRDGQRWYQIPDGIKLPSVTTVLGIKENIAITDWRQSLGEKNADRETKRAAERGTAVHKIIENYLYNDKNPTSGHTIENIKLFNQLKFSINNINNIRAIELPMYSKQLKIAGTADCIAEYNGTLSLIDFKTSNNNKNEKMIENYFKQVTAYSIMYHELYQEPIDNIVIIMCVERGMVPLVFQKSIDNYIAPLIADIKYFYQQTKAKNFKI